MPALKKSRVIPAPDWLASFILFHNKLKCCAPLVPAGHLIDFLKPAFEENPVMNRDLWVDDGISNKNPDNTSAISDNAHARQEEQPPSPEILKKRAKARLVSVSYKTPVNWWLA
ncbi:MAG TPA: hypothetical protein PKE55_15450 [Kiritimatiellia bacterium]|nr:hypothetical protein [Kiritimatiellia bacterium]